MTTLRKTIESFVYPFLERVTDMVYKGGEDTVWHGIRVLDDDIKFTHGAMVNAAATLYVHYVKTNDERCDEVLKRIHYFIKIAASNVCKTWGKIAILRAFNELYENGLLDRVDPEYIALVKDRTNYEDFFDKETVELKNMATNYFQVAMACAGYREKFGWENDGYAVKIKDKLVAILEDKSVDGWMDDELPYGRFDRYAFVLSSEFADTATAVGLSIPDTVKDNLRVAAEIMMFMANDKGNGLTYGRSIACHGDSTAPEILSAAFAAGLIREEERDLAIAYCIRSYENVLNFWYNSEKECFDVWWGGRAYNDYRPIERILETNVDMANHLYMALKNFERAGVADIEPKCTLPSPAAWRIKEIKFIDRPDDVKKTIMLRRVDKLVSLPFVGLGKYWGKKNAYYPFPTSAKVIEPSPESEQPFMLPEYTDENGVTYRPCQFFDKVTLTEREDGATIIAEGYMSITETSVPKKSDVRFKITFEIDGEDIAMRVKTDKPMTSAVMITGASDGGAKVSAVGFDTTEDVESYGNRDYRGIHGWIVGVKRHSVSEPKIIGYDMKI